MRTCRSSTEAAGVEAGVVKVLDITESDASRPRSLLSSLDRSVRTLPTVVSSDFFRRLTGHPRLKRVAEGGGEGTGGGGAGALSACAGAAAGSVRETPWPMRARDDERGAGEMEMGKNRFLGEVLARRAAEA